MKVPTNLRAGAVAAALAGLVVTLGGCGGAATASAPGAAGAGGSLVVVAGGHANMPAAELSGQAAAARDLAVSQGAEFALVVADGAPFVAQDFAMGSNASGAERAADRQRVDEAVASARAKTPESDLLAALTLASRTLGSGPGLRTVAVLDSGLSTTGVLDFSRAGALEANPGEVADSLVDRGQLPDLTGAVVIFQGLGDTVAPQQPLDRVRRVQLQQIWSSVVTRAGAIDVRFDSGVTDPAPAGALPPVAAVALSAPRTCTGSTVKLFNGPVAYQPGSAALIDPDGAKGFLRPVADQILAGDLTAEVFGSYADVGDPNTRRILSEERAQTVANILIGLGVPVGQLRVKGLGSDFPGYIPDRDAGGHLDPAKAALNCWISISYSRNGQPVACA